MSENREKRRLEMDSSKKVDPSLHPPTLNRRLAADLAVKSWGVEIYRLPINPRVAASGNGASDASSAHALAPAARPMTT